MKIEHKSIQLYNNIVMLLENGTYMPGDEFLSENRLCTVFGVCRSTVRSALKELETRGILERTQGKISRFSKDALEKLASISSKNKPKKAIAVLLPSFFHFFDKIFNGLERESAFYNFVCFSNLTLKKEAEAIKDIQKKHFDGAIISPIRYHDNYSLENYLALERSGIPYVMIGRPPDILTCDAVFAADYRASYEMTEKMIIYGCKAMVFVVDGYGDMLAIRERKAGFSDAVKIYTGSVFYIDVRSVAELMQLNSALFDYEKIGIILFDDVLANYIAPMIRETCAEQNKRVGKDILLSGFGNYAGSAELGLTSVELNQSEMCYQAIRLITNLIEERKNSKSAKRLQKFVSVRCDIIWRNSFQKEKLV